MIHRPQTYITDEIVCLDIDYWCCDITVWFSPQKDIWWILITIFERNNLWFICSTYKKNQCFYKILYPLLEIFFNLRNHTVIPYYNVLKSYRSLNVSESLLIYSQRNVSVHQKTACSLWWGSIRKKRFGNNFCLTFWAFLDRIWHLLYSRIWQNITDKAFHLLLMVFFHVKRNVNIFLQTRNILWFSRNMLTNLLTRNTWKTPTLLCF